MLVIKNKVEMKITYPLELFAEREKILFFDIETTGFSRTHCFIYLIGCMYYEDGQYMYTQWFAENKRDEADVLTAFYQFIKNFTTIIHFNGNSFDMPFIKARGENYRLNFNFTDFQGIDIYKSISGFAHIFKLENQKQKTYEKLLNIQRTDPFSGGELVKVYQEYLHSKEEKLLGPLLLHNKEDVWNMGKLLSLYAVSDLFQGDFTVLSFQIHSYEGLSKEPKKELRITLELNHPVPVKISYGAEDCYLTADKEHAVLTVQVISDTLKLFYKNYKEYYYLPLEDEAIHKSLSMFVDAKYRKTATKENCYKKIQGEFLPIYDKSGLFPNTFQYSHSDKISYILLRDVNQKNVRCYAQNILSFLRMHKK